jgi:5-methyltetrahydrofolate--homocysteine methyltransferase
VSIFDEISEQVQKGRTNEVVSLVKKALDEGNTAQQILDDGLLTGMSVLGEKFKNNEVFVPEVLMAARALNEGTDLLKEKLIAEDVKPLGKVVIGTVEGDLHDIGKNLVKLMLEGVGFEVLDLGVDVTPGAILTAVKEFNPDIIALSALLTTTMGNQGVIIKALVDAGVRDQVKVMVGGAPITDKFAQEVGADAYTIDAASAAETAKLLVAK